MPTLTIAFPGSCYHATPWGAHLYGDPVEWPPSPWRISRALLATGLCRLGWDPDGLPEAAVELLIALASVLPEYSLPAPVTVAHSRHHRPTDKEPTKVLDAFARVGDAPLRVGWDVSLKPAAFMLLAELAEAMSYLGPAESWVVASASPRPLREPNCRPHATAELADDTEPVTLLAPMTPEGFATWREGIAAASPNSSGARRPSTSKGAKQGGPGIPAALLECMHLRPADLHAQGWSAPPGTRRVLYTRPHCPRPQESQVALLPTTKRRSPARPPVECALIALTSSSADREVLPQLRLALPQMESLHRGLVSLLENPHACPELTGRAPQGKPLRDGHRHAHYIPLTLSEDRLDAPRRSHAAIDHVLIYADAGLHESAQRAIERLRWVGSAFVPERERDRSNRGRGDPLSRPERNRLTATLVASGDLATIRETIRETICETICETIREHSRHDRFAESRVWESYTPFIAPRYRYVSG